MKCRRCRCPLGYVPADPLRDRVAYWRELEADGRGATVGARWCSAEPEQMVEHEPDLPPADLQDPVAVKRWLGDV